MPTHGKDMKEEMIPCPRCNRPAWKPDRVSRTGKNPDKRYLVHAIQASKRRANKEEPRVLSADIKQNRKISGLAFCNQLCLWSDPASSARTSDRVSHQHN